MLQCSFSFAGIPLEMTFGFLRQVMLLIQTVLVEEASSFSFEEFRNGETSGVSF